MNSQASVKKVIGIAFGISTLISSACVQQKSPRPTGRADVLAGTPGGNNPGGQNPDDPISTENPAGEKFFSDEVAKAFKAATSPSCLECHDAPRNVIGNPDASDEAIYEYASMRPLLLSGEFATDNPVIDPMLGNAPHPGARICSTAEDELCALVVEWWNIETGNSGAVKFGELRNVTFEGGVSGYARSETDSSAKITVKGYVGGDKDSGTLAFEEVADNNIQVDGIQQPFGFRGSIPADMITNDANHSVHVYALIDGEEVELVGSPIDSKLYKPKGQAAVANIINLPGCGGGCHPTNYTTYRANLSTPDPRDQGSPTNNLMYEYANGKAHSGPAINISTAEVESWWRCEFRNECN